MTSNHNENIAGQEGAEHHEGMTKRKIWRVFFYLLALTALEFFIALVLVHGGIVSKGLAVNITYIILTLLKAYYIIAYFMHLKFETFGFIMSTSVVLIFVVYLIVLMLTEGAYLKLHFNPFSFWPNQ